MRNLDCYMQALDDQTDTQEEDKEEEESEYLEEVESVIEEAEMLAIKLEAVLTCNKMAKDEVNIGEVATQRTTVDLPPIPIPTFDGKISEFENFWALFNANIHSQSLTNLQKFNYLLKALRGSAREAIRRYPITEENYLPALNLLSAKFGDKGKLVRMLQYKLDAAKARGNQISHQRQLVDYLIAIVVQLQQNGVNLKGSYVTQKVLAKFRPDLQRRVLKQRFQSEQRGEDWAVSELLGELDTLVKTEEQVAEMLHEAETHRPEHRKTVTEVRPPHSKHSMCIYCDEANHNSLRCVKVGEITDRVKFMRAHRLCMNCGRQNHYSKECTAPGCMKCNGKKHHFSICPKNFKAEESAKKPKIEFDSHAPP
ncbi:unnamed protein product [Nippostrongylus brasiliensis]|uniref:CCHC-type domain-containing protein n=1 Tax=Nippostrongylus brasiliensis TaxID=27835 RepID=A0A0N4XDU6_NIPBR|nr:unnamed protein product [Nippostrongylus brasiliensis]